MKYKFKKIFIGLFVAILTLTIPASVLPDTGVITAKAASEKTALSKKSLSLHKGKSYKLTLKNLKKGSKVKWSSSKKSVATVKAKGNVCTVTGKKTGNATVYARVGKKTYKCKVTVKNPPVALSAKSKTVYINKSFTLTLNNTKSSVKWSTSNKKIAAIKKVSKYKYRVTGKKAGSATVTAKVGKKSYKCKVVVKKEPSAPAKPVQTPTQPKPSQPQTEAPAKPNTPQTEKPVITNPPQTEKPVETEPPQTEKKPSETKPVLWLSEEYKKICSSNSSGEGIVVQTDLPQNSLRISSTCNDMNIFYVSDDIQKMPAGHAYKIRYFGVKKGTYQVTISGGGESVTSTIIIQNDNTEFLKYASWCDQLLTQLGCSKSDPVEALKRVGMWIVDNTDYNASNGNYMYLHKVGGDCEASTGLFLDIAKRVYGLNAYSTNTGAGHTNAAIMINGEKWTFDAGGIGTAGNRGFSMANSDGTKGGIYTKTEGWWLVDQQ